MRRAGVGLGLAGALLLVGGALTGLGLAESKTAGDGWTNLWFDSGLPLMILAIAIGVRTAARTQAGHAPPTVGGDEPPNGQSPEEPPRSS